MSEGDKLMPQAANGTASMVTNTGTNAIDSLLSDLKWSTNTITYSFTTAKTDYADYNNLVPAIPAADQEAENNFEPLTTAQQAAVRSALQAWARVANLNFVETTGGSGDIRFGTSSLPATSWAYWPGTSIGGDVWFGNTGSNAPTNPVAGSYDYATYIHEIGHALGLKHPHDTDGSDVVANRNTDSIEYSIMSYKSYVGADMNGYTVADGSYPTGPMLDDIAAIQYMYGANYSTNSGDTTYTFDPSAEVIFNTIWDGGGNDTYDFSKYTTDVKIDLQPGEWSLSSDSQLAYLGYGHTATGNVANAYLYNGDTRSLIENAIGGSGNDTLEGNQADNVLDGGAGEDFMEGGAGSDTYIVDNTWDFIFEFSSDIGTDTVKASVSYSIYGGVENLTLTGTGNLSGTGNAVDNDIIGNSGNNTLDGGAGADTLEGGSGDDTYYVDNAHDVVIEGQNQGNDTVQASVSYTLGANLENLVLTGKGNINGTGNELANIIDGNSGNNVLSGGDGDDILDGGAGVDTLIGGAGNDCYTVDNSSDVIIEAENQGADKVEATVSYTLADNIETLYLQGNSNINGTGNDLANTIYGNTGNNILTGGKGADTLVGGSGNDTYVVDSQDTVTEVSDAGTDTVKADFSYTLGENIENLVLTGTANINGTGNALTNSITGNNGNNILDGGLGKDTMIGGVGNDTYVVDDTGDVITELSGQGIDTVQSSVNYTLGANVENLILTSAGGAKGSGNNLNNAISGSSGNDTLDGGLGADTLIGGEGNDKYVVDNAGDIVSEADGEGIDTVDSYLASYTLKDNVENLVLKGTTSIYGTGNALSNSITGNAGNNILDGGAGVDTLCGGLGNDTYIVDGAGDVVEEENGQGTDTVKSSSDYTLSDNVENLILIGTANINGTGNSLNNNIVGNSGKNTLDGGLGKDTMTGGLGDDTYVVDDSGDVAIEAAGGGQDTVEAGVSYTLGANIENLVLTGQYDINGTGNNLNNTITGNDGSNVLNGGVGADTMIGGAGLDMYIVDNTNDVIVEEASGGYDMVQASVSYTLGDNLEQLGLTGTASISGTGNALDNTIVGNSGSNRLSGEDGNDDLDGGLGADTLIGGTGDDIYTVDNSRDVVIEAVGEGQDTVISKLASYTLTNNVEKLALNGTGNSNGTGNALNNTIYGNDGNNVLDGGIGQDTLQGNAGNDTYIVDDIGDVITENISEGTDTVLAGVTYTLESFLENLTLSGAANIGGTGNIFDNYLTGNSGNNVLDGGDGDDTLVGGLGSDTLNGGKGNDTLDGGIGTDSLVGGAGDDTYIVDNAGDIVTEAASEGTDTVKAGISYTLTANVENLALTGSGNISGTGNNGDNYLLGNSGNNALDGGAGNDTLDGGAGRDTLVGGEGSDVYIVSNTATVINETGTVGTDVIRTTLSSYTLGAALENLELSGNLNSTGIGNGLANHITGNAGNNTLNGMAGIDTMEGGQGNDVYYVDNTGDIVTENANAGIDTVYSNVDFALSDNVENLVLMGTGNLDGVGNSLNNTVTGNNGNNTLDGGVGADTLKGGLGNDTYIVDNEKDVVSEGVSQGTDTVEASVSYTLSANVENLTLTGNDSSNGTGNAIGNNITGNSGNNILNGGLGADTMIGGAGDDIYYIDNAGDVVTEDQSAGLDEVWSTISHTLENNVEWLGLLGTANISATGNELDNSLIGNSGNNVLDGKAGADFMTGGKGNDSYYVDDVGDSVMESANEGTDTVYSSLTNYTLDTNVENLILSGAAANGTGNELNNVITGNSGNNILDGKAGKDTMAGGLGNDTYIVDNIGDVVVENFVPGIDTVETSISYILGANVENLTLDEMAGNINGTGNALSNVITGNSGDNILNGGAGVDNMIGGLGNDSYYVDNANDTVEEKGNQGKDAVYSSVTYTLSDNVENLTLIGAGAISGTGNDLDNSITGNSAANYLTGGLGNDILNGGAGNDTLEGGLGDDTYVVSKVSGNDRIISKTTGDNGADMLVFQDISLAGCSFVKKGNDLIFTIKATGKTVTLADWGLGTDYQVDKLVFADVTVTADQVESLLNPGPNTMTGTAGNDSYFIDNKGDAIQGETGGNDTVYTALDGYTLANGLENLTLYGTANLSGTGNALANKLTGNSGNNNLSGGDGNDTLDGGLGADTLNGGIGNDTYVVDSSNDVVKENTGEGIDTVDSYVSYTLSTELENLALLGTGNINGTGNAQDNEILGNDGNNILNGGLGADTMAGGRGNDVYYVDNAGDTVTETADAGIDTVYSSVGLILADNVEKLVLTDTAAAGSGNILDNTITGNSVNNTLDGGIGKDTMTGGAGNDTYLVDNIGDVVIEAAGQGTDTVQAGVSYTLSANVENLTLTGTDSTNGTGNALGNIIEGNSGDNILNGGAGADTMTGGLGNDSYYVDNSKDVVTEYLDEGIDSVYSSISYILGVNVENLTLIGAGAISGTGNDLANKITGNGAGNSLYGGTGNDTLDGGAGADIMAGGLGDDTYYVDNVRDVVKENFEPGNDTVFSSVTYTLSANVENLTLLGSGNINGTGNELANTIIGNDGNNILSGGLGIDTLQGGKGNDTYQADADDIIVEKAGEGIDTVNSNLASYTLTANVENLTLTGNGNINGTGNTLANTLIGTSGSNILDGGIGADTMTGGLGNDTYVVDNTGDVVVEAAGQGTDTVQSSITYTLGANVENLTLSGSGYIDGYGNTLNNNITGNAGNNTLDGGIGADTMSGGLGNDTYLVDNIKDSVIENDNSGIDTVKSSISYVLGDNLENLTLTGTALSGTGNELNNKIDGSAGNNILSGDAGNDTLNGGAGNDTVYGGAGNDTLYGGEGNDVLYGGMGDDTFVFDQNIFDNCIIQDDMLPGSAQDTDTLQFTNINSADCTFKLVDNTLICQVGANYIAVVNWEQPGYKIDNFAFSDNTLTAQGVLSKVKS